MNKQNKEIPLEMIRGLGKELWKSLGGADVYIRKEREGWKKRRSQNGLISK